MRDVDNQAEIARKGTPIRRVRVNGAPTLTSLNDVTDDLLNGLDPASAKASALQFKTIPVYVPGSSPFIRRPGLVASASLRDPPTEWSRQFVGART
jgi:hypothetical protein